MHELTAQVLRIIGEAVVKGSIDALVGMAFDARRAVPEVQTPAPVPVPATFPSESIRIQAPDSSIPDPAHGAVVVMDAFLRAIARGNRNTCVRLCEPHWARRPETVALIDEAFAAAPPVRWTFNETWTPGSWRPGRSLPWVVAELPVTHETDGGEVIVPTVLRAVQNRGVWRIDHLEWGQAPAPEAPPEEYFEITSSSDAFFSSFFGDQVVRPPPERVVIDCPRCSRKLGIPGNKGRLRVTCPGCTNVQWFTP